MRASLQPAFSDDAVRCSARLDAAQPARYLRRLARRCRSGMPPGLQSLFFFCRGVVAAMRPDSTMSEPSARRSKLVLGLAVTAILAWLFARGLDTRALAEAFGRLSTATILLALAFIAAAHAVRIVRWWIMLRALDPGLPVGNCVQPFLIGMAFNHILPLRAGDTLRVVGFRRPLRSPAMRVLDTVVIERALDLVAVPGERAAGGGRFVCR